MGTKRWYRVPLVADHLQVTNIVTLFCDFMLIQFVQLQFDVQTYTVAFQQFRDLPCASF